MSIGIPHRGIGPLEWEDPEPHVLIVTAVIPPVGEFDSGELEYTLEHLPICAHHTVCLSGGPPECEWEEYECAVGQNESDVGFPFSLGYSGTPITELGRYLIKAWGRRIPNWEYGDEYDGGVMVVDPESPE